MGALRPQVLLIGVARSCRYRIGSRDCRMDLVLLGVSAFRVVVVDSGFDGWRQTGAKDYCYSVHWIHVAFAAASVLLKIVSPNLFGDYSRKTNSEGIRFSWLESYE